MRKFILSGLFVFISTMVWAQDWFPLLGTQVGVVAGGHMSMLNNRDDINADDRLNSETNFKYSFGVERHRWINNNFGYSAQALYSLQGAAYSGYDTLSKLTLAASTSLTYLKLPVLFQYRSYNQYRPNRRLRANIYFGPYAALLTNFVDKMKLTNSDNTYSSESTVTLLSYSGSTNFNGIITKAIPGSFDLPIYKMIDLGFVGGIGAEMRLWKKTVVALTLRADIGATDVENKTTFKVKYDNGSSVETNYWKELYFKYHGKIAGDNVTKFNRPATKNFSAGVFLSVRKFLINPKVKVIQMM